MKCRRHLNTDREGRRRPGWGFRAVFLIFALSAWAGSWGAEPAADYDKIKAQLKIEIGLKARANKKIEDAVQAFEDAYEAYPANVYPLLLWGDTLCRVGLYQRAQEVLARIPLKSLSPGGQAQVHILFGKIALASGTPELAGKCFSDALKVQPENETARIRLAMVNMLFGAENRATELLESIQFAPGLTFRDRVLVYLMDLSHGNLLRAWENCGELVVFPLPQPDPDAEASLFSGVFSYRLPFFVCSLPLGLSGIFGIGYFLALFVGLWFLASRLITSGSLFLDCCFVALAAGHVIPTWWLSVGPVRFASLIDEFSLNDSVWILPRLLSSGHLIALALFLIFPLFNFLPGSHRPQRYELYSIWFFCWWFMAFVLVFQSRLNAGVRWPVMLVTLGLAGFFCLMMPLGRYIFFLAGNFFGIKGTRFLASSGVGVSGMGFTDAKINESKVLKLLETDEFEQAVALGRKVIANTDRKGFPACGLGLIRALIENEDLYEAEKNLKEFLKVFRNSSHLESGKLLSAWYKSLTGDHAGALSLINSISEESIRGFSANESGLSLLVLGRCNLGFNQAVQAHMDFSKGLSLVKNPLTAAYILCELSAMDIQMNRLDWAQKWVIQANALRGGKKTQSLLKIIESMMAQFQGKDDAALVAAVEACRIAPKNGKAWAWQGHLLCLKGKQSHAEILLQEKMTPGTLDAERLMKEITSRKE